MGTGYRFADADLPLGISRPLQTILDRSLPNKHTAPMPPYASLDLPTPPGEARDQDSDAVRRTEDGRTRAVAWSSPAGRPACEDRSGPLVTEGWRRGRS